MDINFTSLVTLASIYTPLLIAVIFFFVYKKFANTYPTSALIIYGISVFISILMVFYNFDSIDQKSVSLLSGIITGLFILALSIIINYQQIKAIDRFRSLKIKDILRTRDDEDYYRNIISDASTELSILGVTANRFLSDFANTESPKEEKRILISKIKKGMKVKLLLAKIEDDSLGSENLRKYESTREKLNSYDDDIRNGIDCRYYTGKPTQSIFYTENECLVGPVFPEVDSQHTPCIHLSNNSPYAKGYLEFFEKEWNKAKEL